MDAHAGLVRQVCEGLTLVRSSNGVLRARCSRAKAVVMSNESEMADDPVPVEVRNFLIHCIESVAQLEALLLLRATPQRAWKVPDVARRLYVGEGKAAQLLGGLVGSELAVTD